MKSISKKVLGLLICSSVILSSFSMGAYAESSDAGTANYEVAYSGMVDLNTAFGGSSLSASAYSGTYYDQLSTDEQEMYSKIWELFKDGDAKKDDTSESITYDLGITKTVNVDVSNYKADIKFKLNGLTSTAMKAYSALIYDHPELTWLDGREQIGLTCKYIAPTGTGTAPVDLQLVLALSPSVVSGVTPAEMNGLISTAKSAVASSRKSSSDYDTLEAIHDYLCNLIAYNHEAVKSDTKYTSRQTFAYQTAYSAFAKCNGDSVINTVCAGYAKSFKILCDEFGIKCAIISGTGVSDSGSENHAWNAVELDGKWYAVDCTWDDQTEPEKAKKIFKDFFLVGSETVPVNFYKKNFGYTHVNNADFAYPELNPDKYVNPAEVTPGVPTGLNAAADDMEVTLTWDAAENAESYNVYVDGVLKESGITDTTYSVLNLENGTEYSFAVSAVSSTNTESAKSDEVKATPHSSYIPPVVPEAPTGLKAEARDGEVVLTWNSAERATFYNVYVDGVLKESGIYDTTYTVTGLTNGTEYGFVVSAVSSTDNEGDKSDVVTATPVKPAAPEVTPDAPAGLKAAAGDGQVELTWNKSENAKSYTVYQDGKAIKTGLTDTKFTVTGLTNGTKYTFTVTATADKESAKSAEATATPVKPAAPEVTPDAPAGLKAAAGDGQAELTWDKVENAKSYTVYQDGKSIKAGLTDTKFTVTGLTNGTKYIFTVTATADKESAQSAEAAVTPAKAEVPEVTPAAPTGLKATVGDGKVELTWDKVKNAKSYTVYQDGKFIKTGLTDTKFTVTGLTNGTKYTFTVTATADKESAKSAAVEVTPAKPTVTLPAPRGLKAKAGDEEVKLTWDKVDGATSYSVYMDGRLVKSGITDTEYTVTGLKNNERYKFAVSGDAIGANSTRSSTVSARPYHTHTWSDDYKYNSTDHWKYCVMCDEAGTKATHRFSGWKTVYEATKDSAGLKKRTCSVCGYDQEEKIPATSGGSSGGSSSRPSGGSSSGKPSTTTEILPSIGGVDKPWDNVAADIKSAPAGSVIVINSKGSAKLPANVVAAIKSSGAKVELVVDSVKTWIIDGSALNTTAAIDLTSAAGSADTSALRGTVGAKLKTSAANPGAALRLTLKYEYAGQFANLYRVENGKNVFVGCVKVDSFGAAVIPGITSAGEYVVMAGRYSDLSGDSNNDGMINAIDVSDILKHITGISASANIQMADFNGDGTVNALDASAILKAIVSM